MLDVCTLLQCIPGTCPQQCISHGGNACDAGIAPRHRRTAPHRTANNPAKVWQAVTLRHSKTKRTDDNQSLTAPQAFPNVAGQCGVRHMGTGRTMSGVPGVSPSDDSCFPGPLWRLSERRPSRALRSLAHQQSHCRGMSGQNTILAALLELQGELRWKWRTVMPLLCWSLACSWSSTYAECLRNCARCPVAGGPAKLQAN